MRVRTPILACITAITLTSHANALSCSQDGFDLASMIKATKKSDQNFVYVVGKFSGNAFQKTRLRQKSYSMKLRFSGHHVGTENIKPLQTKITANIDCLSPWCGNPPENGKQVIAILERDNNGNLSFNSGPCSPNIFAGDVNTLQKLLN